ncbi:MAG TPA: ATP-dependent DNA helicase [Armatimonadota bacterium]|jgi:DNA helicase-2/ATP-dependent DNA helicase PcrA
MKYEREPSPEQKWIIEEERLDVPLKIVAGAGTGKTFVLAHRFAWLVVDRGLSPDRLLALTFTDNAATEMRTRIRHLLRLNGVADPGPLWVHTFHSFAARVLRENAYLAGRDPEPALLTEVQEALYLEGLLAATGAGEFDHLTALDPVTLAALGVDRAEQLGKLILRLVREAKGSGQTPEGFAAQALAASDRFWNSLPAPDEVQPLSKDEAAQLLWTWATGDPDPPPAPKDNKPVRDRLNDVLKLYFENLKAKQPPARTDTALLFAEAQAAETGVINAATAIHELYRQRLVEEGAIDFDGQIMQAVGLLRDPHLGLAQRYRDAFDYLLLDEFQDTSPTQLEMIRLVARPGQAAPHSHLLVVGDQKQSIYGWRNARPGNLDELLPFQPGEKVDGLEVCRPLRESYRLTEAVAQIANRAGRVARPADPELIARHEGPGRVLYPPMFSEEGGVRRARRAESAWIADQIARLRESGEVEDLSEVAVLLRSRSRFRSLKVAFEQRGVPYQADGGVGFFEHPLARDLIAWLQVLRDPAADLYLTRLLARPPWSLTDRELCLLLTAPSERGRSRRDGSGMQIVAALLAGADERSAEERTALPAAALRDFWAHYEEFRELARGSSARQVLDALWRHCVRYVRLTRSEERACPMIRAAFEGLLASLAPRRPPHLDDLVGALNFYLAQDQRELPVAPQPARGAVRVMTIHRAKGLGFAAVFVPQWSPGQGGGPGYSEAHGLTGLQVRGEDPKRLIGKLLARTADDTDDEDLRLAYVALTRASRVLAVSRAAGAKEGGQKHPRADYFEGLPETPLPETAAASTETEAVRPVLAPRLEELPVRPPRLLRASYTQLRRLEDCPRAWLLARQAPGGLEAEEPADEHWGLEVGSRFHALVAGFYRGEQPPTAKEFRTAAETAAAGLAPEAAARLGELAEAFLSSEWATVGEPREVERPVELLSEVGETVVRLGGALDLWLPGSGRLIDFKTESGAAPSRRANYALQMLIYAEALRGEGLTCSAPTVVQVQPSGLTSLALSLEELDAQQPRLEHLLGRLVEYAAGRPAEATPGDACTWCDFRGLCAAAR